VSWLKEECGLDDSGAEQAIEYILQGRAVLGDVPTQSTIIAERFFDEGGGMQLVIHAPFGGRINKAWGLALRKRFCRSFNFELQAAATDNGLNIALAEQHSFPLADVFHFLQAETVQPILEQAALASPIFGTHWRWDAMRALALLRFQGGAKIPPQIQRMRSDDLLASVFPDVAACQENVNGDIRIPDHPLVNEVMKDVLTEAMDLDGLKDLLLRIADGRIRCVAVDTPVPSQFSHEILNANPYAYLDDAPLEERRARAVEMRRVLPESVLEEVGKLDPVAIAQVREEAWPDVRDADELHDVLHTLIALPEVVASEKTRETPLPTSIFDETSVATSVFLESEERPLPSPSGNGRRSVPPAQASSGWSRYFERLQEQGRAGRATGGQDGTPSGQPASHPLAAEPGVVGTRAESRRYWVAAERAKSFAALFPDTNFDPPLPEIETEVPSRDDALLAMITGWMMHLGPTTASELANILGLAASEVSKAFLRLEAGGAILRGNFTGRSSPGGATAPQETEWCDRRLLARIHRLTVATLRKQIEPVTAAQSMS